MASLIILINLLSRDVEDSGAAGPGWEEVLTWLVEVGAESEGDGEGSEGESGRGTARLSWSAKVSSTSNSASTTEEPPHEHRVNTRLDIEKDDIQAVLPISKVRSYRNVINCPWSLLCGHPCYLRYVIRIRINFLFSSLPTYFCK